MHVCPACFQSVGLGKRIEEVRPHFPWTPCDKHPRRKGVPIDAVGRIVDPVFRAHYAGMPEDGFGNSRGNDLWTTLAELTETEDDAILARLKDWLIDNDSYWPPDGEDAFYSDEYGYVSDDFALDEHGRLWALVRQRLMHEARFFNDELEVLLHRIFDDVHLQRSADRLGPVYFIQPGAREGRFYRARLAPDDLAAMIMADPVSQLGPPPEHLRRPGRMNPSGIAVFYAGFDLDTCVSELRPLVGSGVVVAQFEIAEPILVLDTTRFAGPQKAHDPFAKNAVQRAAQWRFMNAFMLQISQPVSRDDEHLDYVPTQVVAEYLARRHAFSFEGDRKGFDAIIYHSAQSKTGRNIALFGDAARLVQPQIERPPSRSNPDDFWLEFEALDGMSGSRPGRLRLVPDSVKLYRVDRARFPLVEQDNGSDEETA